MKICIVDTERETHNPKHPKLRIISERYYGGTCIKGDFVSSEGCDTSWMSSILQSSRNSTSSEDGSSNSKDRSSNNEDSELMMMTRTVDLLLTSHKQKQARILVMIG